ncbi:hypothetical protein N7465_007553 [Penicillium sp. CMV-2018d]|nr:hypothetical protein N7465_007553 [Penicillium sp. CMV-2018d]
MITTFILYKLIIILLRHLPARDFVLDPALDPVPVLVLGSPPITKDLGAQNDPVGRLRLLGTTLGTGLGAAGLGAVGLGAVGLGAAGLGACLGAC